MPMVGVSCGRMLRDLRPANNQTAINLSPDLHSSQHRKGHLLTIAQPNPLPRRALVGMVHVHALPGTPFASSSIQQLAESAAAEAKILADSGFDALIVENMHDRPYVHGQHGPEVVAAMTIAALACKHAAPNLVMGIQVLSGGATEALAIALATGASFIRCENFVFTHVADEGLLATAEAGPLLRYRRGIGADKISVFCDIKKKHASHAITADISIADAAEAAQFFGADGLIVTGTATGKPTSIDDLRQVRDASPLPLLVGSGVTIEQLPKIIPHADALIVGSSIKHGGLWSNLIDPARCVKLVQAARAVRA